MNDPSVTAEAKRARVDETHRTLRDVAWIKASLVMAERRIEPTKELADALNVGVDAGLAACLEFMHIYLKIAAEDIFEGGQQ